METQGYIATKNLIDQWNADLDRALQDMSPEDLKGFRKFQSEDRRYFRDYWRKRDPIEFEVLKDLGIYTFVYLGRVTIELGKMGFPDIIYHRGRRHPERNGYYVRVAAEIRSHGDGSISFPRTWGSMHSIRDVLDYDKLFAMTVSLERGMKFETLSTWDGERCIPSPQRWWDEKNGPGWFEPGIFA